MNMGKSIISHEFIRLCLSEFSRRISLSLRLFFLVSLLSSRSTGSFTSAITAGPAVCSFFSFFSIAIILLYVIHSVHYYYYNITYNMRKFKEIKELSPILHQIQRFSNSVLRRKDFFVENAVAHFSQPFFCASSMIFVISSVILSDTSK